MCECVLVCVSFFSRSLGLSVFVEYPLRRRFMYSASQVNSLAYLPTILESREVGLSWALWIIRI